MPGGQSRATGPQIREHVHRQHEVAGGIGHPGQVMAGADREAEIVLTLATLPRRCDHPGRNIQPRHFGGMRCQCH